MKVNVNCMNCEITIEEVDGKCVVTALQDGETVEEFTVNCEEDGSSEDDAAEELPTGDEEFEDEELLLDDSEGEEVSEEDEEEVVVEGVKTFTQFYVKK